jgi:hypothetical protein
MTTCYRHERCGLQKKLFSLRWAEVQLSLLESPSTPTPPGNPERTDLSLSPASIRKQPIYLLCEGLAVYLRLEVWPCLLYAALFRVSGMDKTSSQPSEQPGPMTMHRTVMWKR